MSYTCDLYITVGTSKGILVATRRVELPFAPVPGMILVGYDARPEDHSDGDRIEHVSWLREGERFVIGLEGHIEESETDPADVLREFWGHRWRVERRVDRS
jgi:hypothetical protein